MQTIIIVSFICPVPPIQGNRLAIYQLITWLKHQGYQVIFLLQTCSLSKAHRNELKNLVDQLFIIDGRTSTALISPTELQVKLVQKAETWLRKVQSSLRRLAPFLQVNPPSKAKTFPRKFLDCWPETIKTVSKLAQRYQPIAVIAEYLYMTPCFDNLPKTILTLTHTIDVVYRVKQEIGSKGVDTQGRDITPQQERESLLRGDIIIALQEYEAKLFRELVPEREVIILGYSPKYIASEPSSDVIPGRVFMTGGDNAYNRRGLSLLCEKVWPKVLKTCPDAQLIVAGSASDALVPDTPNAQALGIIESLEHEYNQASLVVNPVDLGTGLKIKTVEALCYGKALVSTPTGVEGLPEIEDFPGLIAQNWEDFADKILALLQNDNLRRRFEQKALSYAHAYFTEKYVYAQLQEYLQRHQAKLNSSS